MGHRSVLRVAISASLTLGLTALGLGLGASAAQASSTTPTNTADTGVIELHYAPSAAGLTVIVTAEDPTNPGHSSVVSDDIGSDGSVSITNYAGPVSVDLKSY